MKKRKAPGAVQPNRPRRSPALRTDSGPPQSPSIRKIEDRLDLAAARRALEEPGEIPLAEAVKRKFTPHPSPAVSDIEEDLEETALMSSRHLRRLLQGILLETRTTRQYVMWLHEMLANHELGKEAEVPTRDALEAKMAKKRMKQEERREVQELLARRAAAGIGNGGLDLTADERARIAAGEDIDTVLAGI